MYIVAKVFTLRHRLDHRLEELLLPFRDAGRVKETVARIIVFLEFY